MLKRKFVKIVFLLINCILFTTNAVCVQANENNVTGACEYLRMGIGARAMGMGGAFVSVADDAFAGYWNPAGLSQIKTKEVGTMFNVLRYDRTHGFFNYLQPIKNWGTFGINWIYFGVNNFEGRENEYDQPYEFNDQENTIFISYGKEMLPYLSVGGNLKVYTQKLENEKASGIGFDIGCLYKTPIEHLTCGLSVQNIAGTLKWSTGHKDRILTLSKMGANYKFLDNRLVVALDIEIPEKQNAKLHLGSEYLVWNNIPIRLGLNKELFTGGIGYQIYLFQFDYGFILDTDQALGDKHQISLIVRF